MGAQPSSANASALGLAACLTKPVRQSHLLDAIVSAIPQAAVGPSSGPPAGSPPPPEAPADRTIHRKDARILLAEDNEINREVAREVLANAGCACEMVANGRLALEAVLGARYDLVLMDCQMPEMDGFQAAGAIRQAERDGKVPCRNGKRLPIIALTANAVKGDREQCLEAGMDGYLSKPIDPTLLVATINDHLDPPPQGGAPKPQPPPPATARAGEGPPEAPASAGEEGPFNLRTLLDRCMGKQDFLERILQKFRQKAARDLAELEESVRSRDAEKMAFLAHGLKGAAANVSAEALRLAAGEMEQVVRSGDLAGAQSCLERIRQEVRRCVGDLSGAAV
jgi:CheY-like chemotaxis protein